jgi:hypothetical protein
LPSSNRDNQNAKSLASTLSTSIDFANFSDRVVQKVNRFRNVFRLEVTLYHGRCESTGVLPLMKMKQPDSGSPATAVFLRACTAQSPSDWNGFQDQIERVDMQSWRWIVEMSSTHGLTGLIARSLEWAQQSFSSFIPITAELAARRRTSLIQLLARRAAARLAMEALLQNRIRFVLFKGLALCEDVYGDLSHREFGDCDLLVPFDEAESASEALRSVGYRSGRFGGVADYRARGHHAAPFTNDSGQTIDLHWELSGSEFRPEKTDLIWHHTCLPTTAEALPGFRLTPEMNFIYLATHFYWHSFATFKVMLDVYMTVRAAGQDIDFDRTICLARQLDRLEIIQLTARLCERDFPSLPFLKRLSDLPGTTRMRLAQRILTRGRLLSLDGGHHEPNPLFRLALSGNGKTVMTAIRFNLFPNTEELAGRFGRPFRVSMYPVYYGRQLSRVLARSKKAFAEFD